MDVYHWPSPQGNFGDDLNLWLWDHLLPGFRDTHKDDLLVGVGTVLDTALLPAGRRKVVVGSGTGYGTTPATSDPDEWDIRCVRGPLTARALGLDEALGILDPAAIIPDMPEFKGIKRRGGTVFVPHWESALYGQWENACHAAGVGYIDSCGEAREVIAAIAASSLVIAESMHAAILADAFRVPWIPVSTSAQINPFKWSDWASSLELEYHPQIIPLSSPLEAASKGKPYMGLRWPGNPALSDADEDVDGQTDSATPIKEGGSLKQRVKAVLGSAPAQRLFVIPAARGLKKAAKGQAYLSDDVVYERQKSRFYAVIEQVRQDYGL